MYETVEVYVLYTSHEYLRYTGKNSDPINSGILQIKHFIYGDPRKVRFLTQVISENNRDPSHLCAHMSLGSQTHKPCVF